MVFSLIFDSFYKTATLERYDTFEKLFERVRLSKRRGAVKSLQKKNVLYQIDWDKTVFRLVYLDRTMGIFGKKRNELTCINFSIRVLLANPQTLFLEIGSTWNR